MEATWYAAFPFVGLLLLVGIPILLSWHLSALLFATIFFDFAAKIGFPLASRVSKELNSFVTFLESDR